MSDGTKTPESHGFSLFAPGGTASSAQAKSDNEKPHNASLFSRFTPDNSQDEQPKAKQEKEKKSHFGVIGSIADLAEYGFTIELEEGEDGNAIVEMLNAILPFITPDMLGIICDANLNLVELLDRLQELLSLKDEQTEFDLELLLEEIEKQKQEQKSKPKRLRFKIFGNQREVGLAFEDDLDDENARHAAQELEREIKRLLSKEQAQRKAASTSSLLGLNNINPAATTTERLNFQLRNGGGAMMTVLLSYIIQFAAASIVNTIARGNPNLTGLLTKFDSKSMSKTVHLAGKNGHPGMTATINGSGNNVSVTLQGSADAVKKMKAGLNGMMPKSQNASLWSQAGKSGPDSGPSSGFSAR